VQRYTIITSYVYALIFVSKLADNKTIEAGCKAGAITFMDSAAKQLNPNLSYRLAKFRSSADDCCEESLVLEK